MSAIKVEHTCDITEHSSVASFYRTALHAAQSSHDKAVCLSVKWVICDKTKESYAQIFIPYERTFILVFW